MIKKLQYFKNLLVLLSVDIVPWPFDQAREEIECIAQERGKEFFTIVVSYNDKISS